MIRLEDTLQREGTAKAMVVLLPLLIGTALESYELSVPYEKVASDFSKSLQAESPFATPDSSGGSSLYENFALEEILEVANRLIGSMKEIPPEFEQTFQERYSDILA
jgi:hypothetical protein